MNFSNAVTKLDVINTVAVERVEKSKFLCDVYGYKYRIFMYDPVVGTTSKDSMTVLNNFYIIMNCRFADWTQFELFKFFKNFPESDEQNSNDYIKLVKDHCKILNHAAKNVVRFVNILLKLVSITTSYVDTSLLKTLIFLQYKIDFITSLRDENLSLCYGFELNFDKI